MSGPRVSVEDYKNSEKFLQAVCDNIRRVPGTTMLRAIHSIKSNMVWIRNTVCFSNKCFNTYFNRQLVAMARKNFL